MREFEKSGVLEQQFGAKVRLIANQDEDACMAIDGMKVIDLDSHLVGDLESWDQTVEAKYKEFLPRKLPTKDNERRKIAGRQPNHGRFRARAAESRKERVGNAADLTPQGRVRNMILTVSMSAVLSPNSPALDILWFVDDPELGAAYARAQNNYMDWYASQQKGRLMWAGVIPLQDTKEAIKELHRSRELGSKALNVKATPIPGKEWSDPHFDPISPSWKKPIRRSFFTTPRPAPWDTSASLIIFSSRTWSVARSRAWFV